MTKTIKELARATLARFGVSIRSVLDLSDRGSRVLPMEGLRGVAILLVFLVHYVSILSEFYALASVTGRVSEVFWHVGQTGVDLFFVLSGYLIYGALMSRRVPVGRYLRRRVRRIYPVFLAVFLLYLGISIVAPHLTGIPREIDDAIVFLVLSLVLIPGIVPMDAFVGVAWSLSYEFAFYLTVPFIVFFAKTAPSRTDRFILLGVLAGLITLFFAVAGLHVRCVMFVAGMALWEIIQLRAPRPGSAPLLNAGALALTLGAFAIVVHIDDRPGTAEVAQAFALFIAYSAVCYAAFGSNGLLARLLSLPPMRWLGNISFSFYMIHTFCIYVASRALKMVVDLGMDSVTVYWIGLPVALAFAVVVSFLLFMTIERPLSLSGSSTHARPGVKAALGIVRRRLTGVARGASQPPIM